MKRHARYFLLIAAVITFFIGLYVIAQKKNIPHMLPRMFCVNNTTYVCYGKEADGDLTNIEILGMITKCCSAGMTEMPTEHEQTNCQEWMGVNYGTCNGQMYLLYDEKWRICIVESTAKTFAEELCLDSTLLSDQGTDADMIRRNSTHIAYVENYWEDGAQSPWKYQVWLMDIQTKEKASLYESADIYLLNELYMNEQYAYWVEHVIEGEQMLYFLKQCNLSTGEIIIIAERDDAEADPISLWVSENYVTWMESNASGNTKLIVFDIKKQEYINLDNIEAVRFMPYARLTVVENGITYFSTDAENVLYINRYNLDDSSTKSVKIDNLTKLMNTEKVAECFSNERYIGWLTEYVRGTYYIYDTQSEKQYCLEGLNAFIELMWKDEMIFYNRDENKLAVYDLEKGSFTYQADLPGSGTQLLYYQDSIPYISLNKDGKCRIFSYK